MNDIQDDKEYLSPEGHKDLTLKLEMLKTKKRLEIAGRLEYAKELGDLSENAEYSEAKEEQMTNEAEISKLEDILSRATVIEGGASESVRIGSVVSCTKGREKTKFTIVGREEADPNNGKISNESPIGKAFIGRKKNDKFLVTTPRGSMEYVIVDIA
jgi:transcription elongation factor GreA